VGRRNLISLLAVAAALAATATATAAIGWRTVGDGTATGSAVLVAVFGEYGCNDGNVVATAIVRRGSTLTVDLVPRPPAPGTATCQALFATYRFLAVPRSALGSSLPTGVVVHFA
jgi:hypothetical protein